MPELARLRREDLTSAKHGCNSVALMRLPEAAFPEASEALVRLPACTLDVTASIFCTIDFLKPCTVLGSSTLPPTILSSGAPRWRNSRSLVSAAIYFLHRGLPAKDPTHGPIDEVSHMDAVRQGGPRVRGGCTPCWPADYEIVPEEVQASRATKPEKNKRRLRHSCSISSFHLAAF